VSNATGYLLDTSILVHLIRGDQTGKHVDAKFGLRENLLICAISVVTVGEILSIAMRRKWADSKTKILEKLLDRLLQIDINDRDILEAYAAVDNFSLEHKYNMGKNDIWIAATAKATGYTLLTNDKDFQHLNDSHIKCIYINPDKAGG
jgi:predicted nucleic acid-binding protein